MCFQNGYFLSTYESQRKINVNKVFYLADATQQVVLSFYRLVALWTMFQMHDAMFENSSILV